MIKITKKQLQKIIIKTLSEGKPFGSNLSGLFRQEQTPEEAAAGKKAPAYDLMSLADDDDEERTDRLVDYGVGMSDEYDIEREVVRTPMTRTRSIPGEAPNPFVPGETYDDTRRRVVKTAKDINNRSKERMKKAAEERAAKELAANRAFVQDHQGESTGVLPYNSPDYLSDEIDPTWNDTEFEELMNQLRAVGDVEFTMPVGEPAPLGVKPEKTIKLDRRKNVNESLSRGALIRNKYYGRY